MQELIESGQFLTLSRRNSALFERSHQFTLANGTLV
ncbi:MAG TPA: succinylglutamate desuccinylase, partial [Alteromonas macleodii]|nr:succinylglutamate desuccinylase [Alteromonas macleodii]HBI74701.1 succinylglutamate desuccinylase [Alteromonas macleodii]